MLPRVSIIIPTYNRSDFLGETLEAILAQSYRDWECIVVDDGSTDYTQELAEFYCGIDNRIKFYIRPSHLKKGANSCRNYGYKLSQGEFINWFDDDDYMLHNFIEVKMDAMTELIDLAICTYKKADNKLNKPVTVQVNQKYNLFKSFALYQFKMVTNSVIFRRTFLENRPLFDLELNRGQETEFFTRMFYNLKESSYSIIDIPLFLYRSHNKSKSFFAENSNYKFRTSLLYVSTQFIKKGMELNDFAIINFHYKKCFKLYMQSIRERQIQNVQFFEKNIIPMMFKINFLLALELFVFGKIFWISNRSWYAMEMRLKNYL